MAHLKMIENCNMKTTPFFEALGRVRYTPGKNNKNRCIICPDKETF